MLWRNPVDYSYEGRGRRGEVCLRAFPRCDPEAVSRHYQHNKQKCVKALSWVSWFVEIVSDVSAVSMSRRGI